jgi:hypothetical protein
MIEGQVIVPVLKFVKTPLKELKRVRLWAVRKTLGVELEKSAT